MTDELIVSDVPVIIWKFSGVEYPFVLKSKPFQLFGTEVKLKIFDTDDCWQIVLENGDSSFGMDLISVVLLTTNAYSDDNPNNHFYTERKINLRLMTEHIIWHKTAASLSYLKVYTAAGDYVQSACDCFKKGYFFRIKFYPSGWNPEAVRPSQIEKNPDLSQLCTSSFFQDISALFDDPSFSDVVIDCLDGQQIKAHRAVLAARSEFFAALFQQDPQRPKEQPLSFEDVAPSVLRQVLKFIYSGDVQGLDSDSVHKVYVAADKFKVDFLKMRCGDFMMRKKDADAKDADDDEEQEPSAEEAVLKHFKGLKDLFQSKEWQQLSKIEPEVAKKTVKFLVEQSPSIE